ncbi:MAG: hypothetical protein V4463_06460 [Pseudomonadota bacterium]
MQATAFALALALTSAPALAQTAPPSCADALHHQFDFWIGQWDVYAPNGKKVGESRIEAFGAGCALLEHWSGSGGVTGKSLNMYDASDKQWHQAWVDSSGSRLLLDGQFSEGKMVLASAGQKISWSVNPDGSVRQHWQSSTDGGKTWSTAFDGKYVRRP